MYQQKWQAGLDTHEGLLAQKDIDEIVRPHVEPHVDNHALADSTVLIRGGTKNLYNKDKSGRSCQCNRPAVVSRETRY